MGYARYSLPDGRELVIMQYATIGNPQLSTAKYCHDQVEKGETKGDLIEGKWYTIPTARQLAEEISDIINEDARIRVTIGGHEVITKSEIVDRITELLKSYSIYKERE